MRITKLCLTNFRSFKERQVIEFSPVTLLFGPNSVGKSSVILALFYLHQVLTKGKCNPAHLDAQGSKFIGGFRNLVNGRDISKSIVIELEYSLVDSIGTDYEDETYSIEDPEGLEALNPLDETELVNVKLTISWSRYMKTAYVSSLELELDGVELLEAVSDEGLRSTTINRINYLHPYLAPERLLESFNNVGLDFDPGEAINSENYEEIFSLQGSYVSNLHRVLTSEEDGTTIPFDKTAERLTEHMGMLHSPIGFRGRAGALPVLDEKLVISRDFDNQITQARILATLSNMVVAPLDNLSDILEKSLCIGPIRMIPDANFQSNPHPARGDWHDGRAAWDLLSQGNVHLMRDVSEWMSSPEKLNLGYGVSLKVEKHIAEFKHASKQVNYEDMDNQLESVLRAGSESIGRKFEFDRITTDYGYELWDANNHMEVTASEIGVGISQLLPLVVASCVTSRGMVTIEQPELHVHPRIQVAIGDLLTQIENGPSFLIETHSEHIILRLLKRIRQTTDSELPEGFRAVKPSDVSIVYLKATDNGVKVERIAIDEDGDFVERWPDGFFAERREEFI